MASSSSPSSSAPELELLKEIRRHEVAIDELNNLPSSRPVYQKSGNLFFHTTLERAKNIEQKQLDKAKAGLEKLNSER